MSVPDRHAYNSPYTGEDNSLMPSQGLPERRLLAAILERAVLDLTKTIWTSKKALEHLQKIQKARDEQVVKMVELNKSWRESGLNRKAYCAKYGVDMWQLKYAAQYRSVKKANSVRTVYPSAQEWVADDSHEPFSVHWVLIHLYGSAEPMLSHLRVLARGKEDA